MQINEINYEDEYKHSFLLKAELSATCFHNQHCWYNIVTNDHLSMFLCKKILTWTWTLLCCV